MTYLDIARAQLRIDEGEVLKVYPDTKGIPTIGVGRNLQDKGITRAESAFLFANDVTDAEHDARVLVSNFDALTDGRKAVLVNMAFNLGRERLAGFPRFLAAVRTSKWEEAAAEIIDSNLARARAGRLAVHMKDGA